MKYKDHLNEKEKIRVRILTSYKVKVSGDNKFIKININLTSDLIVNQDIDCEFLKNNEQKMSVEIENEEKRKRELRALTKTFFGIEKPLLMKYTKAVNNMDELISQLHCIFSSDSVNIE